MKKNLIFRAAGILLVLVLATTCIISGTFAKYTTGATAEATARAAKWGVEISVTGDPLFSTEYAMRMILTAVFILRALRLSVNPWRSPGSIITTIFQGH